MMMGVHSPNQWSPIFDVAAILLSIQSLLCDPNPNSPTNFGSCKNVQRKQARVQQESVRLSNKAGLQTTNNSFVVAFVFKKKKTLSLRSCVPPTLFYVVVCFSYSVICCF